ncbi:hypothetical protein CL652_02445 [bacterium]|nr:hypothetical protein [bacterium]|tara:strand:+ start:7834 stop:8463 length:630 start_codon:yes stop_codon:yes gene_type:complete
MLNKQAHTHRGFTLVEMLVAVALFAVVMTVSVGALLAMVDANRKAQALQSVMNNLNVALDGMVRNIRMGVAYHCGNSSETNKTVLSTRSDCVSGGDLLAFESFGNSQADTGDQWVYWFQDGRIWKSEDARDTALPITAPEVEIDSFDVFVTGAEGVLSSDGDTTQPKVVFSIQGTAGAQNSPFSVVGTSKRIRTTFNIQAVASQRLLDL